VERPSRAAGCRRDACATIERKKSAAGGELDE
jgi:hypothetical protein